jgi:hypothetical protein
MKTEITAAEISRAHALAQVLKNADENREGDIYRAIKAINDASYKGKFEVTIPVGIDSKSLKHFLEASGYNYRTEKMFDRSGTATPYEKRPYDIHISWLQNREQFNNQ